MPRNPLPTERSGSFIFQREFRSRFLRIPNITDNLKARNDV